MEILEMFQALQVDEASLRRYKRDLVTLQKGGTVDNLTVEGAERALVSLRAVVDNKRALIESSVKSEDVPEPPFVRVARLVLKEGIQHIDNFTGKLVHEKKVERACHRQGQPTVFEKTEEDESIPGWDDAIVIKRKRGGPKINPVLLDATTASMIVAVWEKTNAVMRLHWPEFIERLTCIGFIGKLWKMVR